MAKAKLPLDPQKIKTKSLAFQREVVDKMSALATAAFGLVAALAWNNAIQAVFARYYPAPVPEGATPPVLAPIGPLMAYAAIITLIAVAVILLIGRLAGRLKAEADEQAAKAAASASA
jgi:hypothetical protein